MKIQSVAVLGAGAVGSYIVWGLSDLSDIDFCLVADGERKDRLVREGLVINDKRFSPVIKTPEEAKGVDLLIVCTKYNHLRDSLSDIKTIADQHTMVMSLLNGVDSEDIIAEAIGYENIMYSLIKIASERKGNSVKFNPVTTPGVIFGEKEPDKYGTERVDALKDLFGNSGVKYRIAEDIAWEMWGKFHLNISNNLIQACMGVGVGAYTDSEHMAFLQKAMGAEVEKIALAKGVDLSKNGYASCKGAVVAPRARYSTLQDLDAKRHTEIDMFSGAVVRMGLELGIETPYNEFVFHFVKALEEKNDGLFDYQ